MIKNKYLLMAGLATALASQPAFAQESQMNNGGTSWSGRDMTYRGESYDVLDSNYVPGRRLEQHRKYLNHEGSFPSKPRSMWELGFAVGTYNYSSDVASEFFWHKGGYAASAHVRKAIGYTLSWRLDYNYGVAKGLNFQPSSGYALNTPVADAYPSGAPIFYNYKSESHQLNLDMIVSLGNILFHKSRAKIDPYIFGGIAGNAYQTWLNLFDEQNGGLNYEAKYNTLIANYPGGIKYDDRRTVKRSLRDLLDDTYETSAQSDAENKGGTRRPGIFKSKKLTFATSFGLGVQFRLSNRVNLALEDRITFFPTTNEDVLDGQKWDENTVKVAGTQVGVPSQNKDGINYLSLGLNFNLGSSSRNVEPLYWLNPLDHAYSELSSPRQMILPDATLADADGDGITDQFDRCPGTPAGVAVDSHGCPLDTDGDGVPDDRDKELITPTYCQPVDADGIGKCPCPEDCGPGGTACANIGSGVLDFGTTGTRITPNMQSQLAVLAAAMQANPTCRVVIAGNGAGSKIAQQRSWDRVNAVIEYMSEKNNIDRTRFIFQYEASGMVPANSVMFRSANVGEEGPSNTAPPHPNLRR